MSGHAVLRTLVFALSLGSLVSTWAQVPSDTSEQGAWGEWGPPAYCPAGQYVWGFRVKGEPYQGNGDDTALNAVQLICKSGASGAPTYIRSLEGKWGSWGSDHVCRETPVIGFSIQVERFQGKDKGRRTIPPPAISRCIVGRKSSQVIRQQRGANGPGFTYV